MNSNPPVVRIPPASRVPLGSAEIAQEVVLGDAEPAAGLADTDGVLARLDQPVRAVTPDAEDAAGDLHGERWRQRLRVWDGLHVVTVLVVSMQRPPSRRVLGR